MGKGSDEVQPAEKHKADDKVVKAPEAAATQPGGLVGKADLAIVKETARTGADPLAKGVLPDTRVAGVAPPVDKPDAPVVRSEAPGATVDKVALMGDPYSKQYNDLAGALARWGVDAKRIPTEPGSAKISPETQYSDLASALKPESPTAIRLGSGEILRNPNPDELAEKLGLHVHPNQKDYDIVVVGAGPGGFSAGINGAAEGYKTVVIGGDAIGGQAGLSSMIENLPGFPQGISGPDLTQKNRAQADRLGAELLVHNWANEITTAPNGDHIIKLSDGSEIKAKAVILATGLQPRELKGRDGTPIPGIEEYTGKSVFYGSGPEQSDSVDGQRITIIGAANSAGQAAVNMAENGARSVDICVRGAGLEEGMSAYLVDKINNINAASREKGLGDVINVHTKTSIDEKKGVEGDGRKMTSVNVNTDGQSTQIPADKMLVFIGSEPKGDLGSMARDSRGLLLTGSEIGDKWGQSRKPLPHETSVPGIFAIGDGETGQANRVAIAQGQGSDAVKRVIAYNAIREADAKKAADGGADVRSGTSERVIKEAAPGTTPEGGREKSPVQDLLQAAGAGDDAARTKMMAMAQTEGITPASAKTVMDQYAKLPPEARAEVMRQLTEQANLGESGRGARVGLAGAMLIVAAVAGAFAESRMRENAAAPKKAVSKDYYFLDLDTPKRN